MPKLPALRFSLVGDRHGRLPVSFIHIPMNPASPSSSSDTSASPRKPWPPPSDELHLIGDFAIPHEIDVDVTTIEFLSIDDPAFVIHYALDAEIHAALGVVGSPVPQGGNPAASAVAFRQWVVGQFVAISGQICRTPRAAPLVGHSDCCFQRMSNHEAIAMNNTSFAHHLWHGNVVATGGARTGVAYQLTPSPGGAGAGGRSPRSSESRCPFFIVP